MESTEPSLLEVAWVTVGIDRGSKIRELVAAGADIEQKDQFGLTPLIHAAQHSRVEAVRTLLELGADVHAQSSAGWTVLSNAGMYGETTQKRETIELLLDAGLDIDAVDGSGYTPLAWAISEAEKERVMVLAELGADINKPSAIGAPINIAIDGELLHGGRKEIINYLVELGVDLTDLSEEGANEVQKIIAEMSDRVDDSVVESSATTWYECEDIMKSVRQVVVTCDLPKPVASKFGTLFLVDKYEHLRESYWTTGFFRLDSDPGPYLLLKANSETATLKSARIRIAFCFYRMQAGGLISVFVDFPDLKIEGNPYDPFVLFEMTRGLDGEDERDRITDAISKRQLHICVAEGAGGGIEAQYDLVLDIDHDCQDVLYREWNSLLVYHDMNLNRDFQASVAQMQSENPLSENPILDQQASKTPIPVEAVSSSKPWWAFWR